MVVTSSIHTNKILATHKKRKKEKERERENHFILKKKKKLNKCQIEPNYFQKKY